MQLKVVVLHCWMEGLAWRIIYATLYLAYIKMTLFRLRNSFKFDIQTESLFYTTSEYSINPTINQD